MGCTSHPPAGIACPPTIPCTPTGCGMLSLFRQKETASCHRRLVNYGVKKSAVSEREERRIVRRCAKCIEHIKFSPFSERTPILAGICTAAKRISFRLFSLCACKENRHIRKIQITMWDVSTLQELVIWRRRTGKRHLRTDARCASLQQRLLHCGPCVVGRHPEMEHAGEFLRAVPVGAVVNQNFSPIQILVMR